MDSQGGSHRCRESEVPSFGVVGRMWWLGGSVSRYECKVAHCYLPWELSFSSTFSEAC